MLVLTNRRLSLKLSKSKKRSKKKLLPQNLVWNLLSTKKLQGRQKLKRVKTKKWKQQLGWRKLKQPWSKRDCSKRWVSNRKMQCTATRKQKRRDNWQWQKNPKQDWHNHGDGWRDWIRQYDWERFFFFVFFFARVLKISFFGLNCCTIFRFFDSF